MIKKFNFNPLTNKKLRPRVKFNNGRGAILCHKCNKIIKEYITLRELKTYAENLFCSECAKEMLIEIFKTNNYE